MRIPIYYILNLCVEHMWIVNGTYVERNKIKLWNCTIIYKFIQFIYVLHMFHMQFTVYRTFLALAHTVHAYSFIYIVKGKCLICFILIEFASKWIRPGPKPSHVHICILLIINQRKNYVLLCYILIWVTLF